MQTVLDKYYKNLDEKFIEGRIVELQNNIKQYLTIDYLKQLFGCIDLTSLNIEDNDRKILEMCRKLNDFSSWFPDINPVAAVCVYPSLVHLPKNNLRVPGMRIASVAGGFPSSQTFLEVKIMEAEMAVEAGANEIDTVMLIGSFLAGDYIHVAGEINSMKRSVGKAHLKVILETGVLENLENIRNASLVAIQAGADFIKTSTGKTSPAATYKAVYVMADAAGDFYRKTGKKTGIKPAGGIVYPEDAAMYAAIVTDVLGNEWLTPELFRIGASRLANNLLSAMNKLETGDDREIIYF